MIAVATPRAAGLAEVFTVLNDHLGRPIQIRDTFLQTVWAPVFEPFGAVHKAPAPETNGLPGLDDAAEFVFNRIDNALNIEFNLRFPGQYYDVETNLHYNYFRDYDPSLGRYMQSDLIGLRGGANTFAYAFSNPLR